MTTTTDPDQYGIQSAMRSDKQRDTQMYLLILGATNSVLALWHCSLTSCKKEADHILAS